MVKRIVASGLWFLAVGWGLNFIAAVADVSQVPGLAIAAAVATFVAMDPLHVFWPVPAPRASVPVGPELQSAPPQGALAAR